MNLLHQTTKHTALLEKLGKKENLQKENSIGIIKYVQPLIQYVATFLYKSRKS